MEVETQANVVDVVFFCNYFINSLKKNRSILNVDQEPGIVLHTGHTDGE